MKRVALCVRRYSALLLVAGLGFACGLYTQGLRAEPSKPTIASPTPVQRDNQAFAREWVRQHRKTGGTPLAPGSRQKRGRSHYFSRTTLMDLLNQKDAQGKECVGLRFYNARDENKAARLLVVSVAETGFTDLLSTELLPPDKRPAMQQTYLIGLSDEKCPDNCDGSFLLDREDRE